ncbi:MAG: hypothetical protein V1720_12670 [bacterium]
MKRSKRDRKFVIYQVLYIFVITVLALKGAGLDLGEVISKREAVSKNVRDSLMILIDSLNAQGLKFNIEIDPSVLDENKDLKDKLASILKSYEELQKEVVEMPPPEEKEEEKVVEETKMQSPLSESQKFIQNTWNIARNNGTVPTYIYDPKNSNQPLAVVPPGGETKFDLRNQTEVVVKFGTQEERVRVVPNRQPEMKIELVTTKMSGRDISVRELQRVTVFTVTILDERPDQLEVMHTGPISVNGPLKDSKGNLVYNVSLKIAGTETKFDEWVDKNENLQEPDGKYKANFFFTVVDKISKDRIQQGDSFYFSEF